MKFKLQRIALEGDKKGYYFPRALHLHKVTTKDVAELIQRNCTVKTSDIMAVLYELAEVMHDQLILGNSVQLDRIGNFSAGIVSDSVKDPNDVGDSNIYGLSVHFSPQRYKTTKIVETRADGTKVARKVFTTTLTHDAEIKPMAQLVQPVIDAYNAAQGTGN
jgi:predicted histone-like DNA-binding protein